MNTAKSAKKLEKLTETIDNLFRQAFIVLPWFCKNVPDCQFVVCSYDSISKPVKAIKRNKPDFFGENKSLAEANGYLQAFYRSFKPAGSRESNAEAVEIYRNAWKSAWKNRQALQLRSTETKLMKYFHEITAGSKHVHLPELQALARHVSYDVVASARSVSIAGGWQPGKAFALKDAELKKIRKSLFGTQEVTALAQQKIRAAKPDKFKVYQQTVKDRKHAAWLRMVEIFDEEGWHPAIDSATLHLRLKQEGLQEYLPENFRGRVGVSAEGYPFRFYTYANLELDAVPLNDVEMNMDYADPPDKPVKSHPAEDRTFYCQTSAMVGNTKTKYYTVDYRRRARQIKYECVDLLGDALPDIRKRLGRHVNSAHRDTAVRALMCMFIDHTCARIGNMTSAKAVKQTFGVTTLLTKKHARIKGGKIIISYTGKHEQQQEHVFRFNSEDPVESLIAGKLKTLIRESNEYLFTNADGKGFTPHQVNDYFRADLADAESNLPDGGANSPCTVHCFRNYHATRMFDEFSRDFELSVKNPSYREVLNAYQGCNETGKQPAVEGILQKIARYLGNTPAICRKSYIKPASQLLFFTKWGYRPPDGLLKDVYHDEMTDPYGISKHKQFSFKKRRAAASRRRKKIG